MCLWTPARIPGKKRKTQKKGMKVYKKMPIPVLGHLARSTVIKVYKEQRAVRNGHKSRTTPRSRDSHSMQSTVRGGRCTLQALLSFPREPFEIVTFALATHGTTVAFRTSNQRDTGVVYAHITQLKSSLGVDWFACSRIDISIALFLPF